MRVTSQSAYNNLLRDIERISERMQNTQLELSSGKKLHKPSDNPAAVSDVIRIAAEQGEVAQYQDNLASAKGRLGVADTTLQGVETMVERVRTLALLSLSNLSTANLQTSEIFQMRAVFLCGGGARVPGLAEALGRRLRLPVEQANPLANIRVRDGALDGLVTDEVAPLLMLPIGLALRKAA